ncbi:MAG: DegT/DnrJ/EryC1/StrS family aminotransferase [Spirochaetaceae bacterium]|nr:MAG: DegT/DnrJ/EryC1/StrS family aminotransferase [Spirochaetaceae bacterium]
MARLAVLGGSRTKTKSFPKWPQYDRREEDALQQVLRSRRWARNQGTQTAEFEKAFAEFQDAKYAVAISSGTQALEVTLGALGIGPGDEVIVPDYSFFATASAVLSVGALPIFVDITDTSYCIEPDQIEPAISDRTKAVIAVHVGGHPADLDRLYEISHKNGLVILEDCAHAHGSEWRGKKVGTFGSAGAFSFQSSKLITAGEGGIILTNNKRIEQRARSIHDCGRLPGGGTYDHYNYGSNCRLTEWQGAILRVQLTRFKDHRELRMQNAKRLSEMLSKIDGITPLSQDERCTYNSYFAFIFRYDCSSFLGLSGAGFREAMQAEGIPIWPSYPPLNQLHIFQKKKFLERLHIAKDEIPNKMITILRSHYPVTEKASREAVWLPHHTLLGDEQDLSEIVEAVKKIQDNARELVDGNRRAAAD